MSMTTVGLFLRHLALSEEVSRLAATSDHDLLAIYEAERGQAAFCARRTNVAWKASSASWLDNRRRQTPNTIAP
jgi:hypothetical protein